jgi:glycolate oxidase FAD binding subunit
MHRVTPSSAEDLAFALQEAASKRRNIETAGNNSKRLMGGPVRPAEVLICTRGLRRVLQYEPNDLTISVEAGMAFADLQKLLAANGQMIALDPPFPAQATVGGIVAANSSGPLRRLFGTARDLIIGMQFATLEGRLVRTGGMVVKNVAGLDMGKLMIGSFGTLAVITSVNFRIHPLPEQTNTFLLSFPDLDSAIEKRDAIVRSILRPMALEIISPPAAARLGASGYVLVVRVSGSGNVLARYAGELASGERLSGAAEAYWWKDISDFSAEFIRRQPNGVVVRLGTKLTETQAVLRLVSGPCICHAGSGVTYAYLTSWQALPALWQAAVENGWSAAVEFAPEEKRSSQELWLLGASQARANAFAIMKKVKQMFDPDNLLNRSRLYGRI